MLKAQVAEQLQRIVTERGSDIGSNPRLLRALLNDYCPADRLESNLLVQAAQAQVPADLFTATSTPWSLLQGRMVSRLVDELGMARENAEWAVDAWGKALGRTETTLQTSETTAAILLIPPQPAKSKTFAHEGTTHTRSSVQYTKTDPFPSPEETVVSPPKGRLPRLLCVFDAGKKHVVEMLFSHDGNSILRRISSSGSHGWWQWFDATTGVGRQECGAFTKCHLESVLSPNGKLIACPYYSEVRLVDATNGEKLREWGAHNSNIVNVTFSQDNMLLATGGDDRIAKIWETENGRLVYKLGSLLKKHKARVERVAFSPDGYTLATHAANETWFWSVGTGQLVETRQTGSVKTLFYLPDGSLVLLGDCMFKDRMWVQQGKNRYEWKKKYRISFTLLSPDACLLAEYESKYDSNNNRTKSTSPVIVWDVESQSKLMSIEGYAEGIYCARFSPDSTRLALGMNDGTIHVWQIR